MTRHSARRLASILTAGIVAVSVAGTALAAPSFRKVAFEGATFKDIDGYVTECRSTTTSCKPVYLRSKSGKYTKLAAKSGTLRQMNRQTQVCYNGSHNATVCYWIYSSALP